MPTIKQFLAADRDAPCKDCEKVRQTCRHCERCKDCCECPICPHCGLADMLGAEQFIAAVGGHKLNYCRCERCPDCRQLFDPDTGGWLEESTGPMYCGKCLNKRERSQKGRTK